VNEQGGKVRKLAKDGDEGWGRGDNTILMSNNHASHNVACQRGEAI